MFLKTVDENHRKQAVFNLSYSQSVHLYALV